MAERRNRSILNPKEDPLLVCILQPGLFPWIGTFEKWSVCDIWVHLDHVQMQKGGFLNRLLVADGDHHRWLTLPALRTGLSTPISEVRLVSSPRDRARHLHSLEYFYRDAPHTRDALSLMADVYRLGSDSAAVLAMRSMEVVIEYLQLGARPVFRSSNLSCASRKTELIGDLVSAVGGDSYLFGPGRRGLSAHYIQSSLLTAKHIDLYCMEYTDERRLSILHAIAQYGPDTKRLIHPRYKPVQLCKCRACRSRSRALALADTSE